MQGARTQATVLDDIEALLACPLFDDDDASACHQQMPEVALAQPPIWPCVCTDGTYPDPSVIVTASMLRHLQAIEATLRAFHLEG